MRVVCEGGVSVDMDSTASPNRQVASIDSANALFFCLPNQSKPVIEALQHNTL